MGFPQHKRQTGIHTPCFAHKAVLQAVTSPSTSIHTYLGTLYKASIILPWDDSRAAVQYLHMYNT